MDPDAQPRYADELVSLPAAPPRSEHLSRDRNDRSEAVPGGTRVTTRGAQLSDERGSSVARKAFFVARYLSGLSDSGTTSAEGVESTRTAARRGRARATFLRHFNGRQSLEPASVS